jgi:predicted MFS family arabinose efflux permease
MASFSTAFPLSNGTGALINGIVVDLAGYRWMYGTAGLLCALGFILIWRQWAKLK